MQQKTPSVIFFVVHTTLKLRKFYVISDIYMHICLFGTTFLCKIHLANWSCSPRSTLSSQSCAVGRRPEWRVLEAASGLWTALMKAVFFTGWKHLQWSIQLHVVQRWPWRLCHDAEGSSPPQAGSMPQSPSPYAGDMTCPHMCKLDVLSRRSYTT